MIPPVHPRACGEHIPRRRRIYYRRGSSPRLRGTRIAGWYQMRYSRFIPAPAGNTRSSFSSLAARAVHPRACGEHQADSRLRAGRGGSSPRLRGTRRAQDRRHVDNRFIPAPAGNTKTGTSASRPSPVHPRACGEHSLVRGGHLGQGGSSPRLRGTPWLTDRGFLSPRFIPAPAGNTVWAFMLSPWLSVHPRACGEHCWYNPATDFHHGSSPRLRGTRSRTQQRHAARRFIPAPAGNTHADRDGDGTRTVHPRACGEHVKSSRIRIKNAGSSPRLRGTLFHFRLLGFGSRFIPAPAGNTPQGPRS